MKRKILRITMIVVAVSAAIVAVRQQRPKPYQENHGFIFGTIYNITYQSDKNLQSEIEAELKKVDSSLSIFNKNSVISKINNNESTEADSMFSEVFMLASKVSAETSGAFDITVAPLVNAWGFGFKNDITPSEKAIDSLRQIIGFDKVSLVNGRIAKKDKRIMIDCGAIAKGYGSDVVARLLKSKGISNFMIEIGGEIVAQGLNKHKQPWQIGVTKPADDSLSVNAETQTIIGIKDKAMATSGNYRNFYYKDGKKYAHTIDPKTGYPVQHNILSATVIADNCATADAYATAFMVLGLDKAKEILSRHPELSAYIIYSDDNGNNAVWQTDNIKQ